ncbi:hypothetical protein NONI108955_36795 [Nocardia ninae]|uniref:Ribbon-helix-helix protein CopG domain-containing protein n=1 Tax=Nocardia ninae NBRC 108245 TaxID=1210091 RepID=A0A511MDH7_9NOCA|nr:hypothetical protein [Nocardia ninae]GEM38649.1 hypothetical protein NN4_31680 [Nocardia ninae NBRC 108245]
MAKMTFTVRVSPEDHQLLSTLAASRKQSVAEQSREILAEGIRRLLDPAEIDRRLSIERARLMEASQVVRARGPVNPLTSNGFAGTNT